MRGRTNVKDGISLNASVEEYEVASGESIVAGNMVEMKTVYSDGYNLNDDIKAIHTLSDGRYILFCSKIYILTRNNDGEYEQSVTPISYSSSNFDFIEELGLDTYIGFHLTNMYLDVHYFKYNITTNVLTTRSERITRSSSFNTTDVKESKCIKKDGFFYIYAVGSVYASSSYRFTLLRSNISISGNAYDEYTASGTYSEIYTSTTYVNITNFVCKILVSQLNSGALIIFGGSDAKYVSDFVYRFFCYQTYTNIQNVSIANNISSLISINDGGYNFCLVNVKDNYISMLYTKKRSSTSSAAFTSLDDIYYQVSYIDEYLVNEVMTVVKYNAIDILQLSDRYGAVSNGYMDIYKIREEHGIKYYLLKCLYSPTSSSSGRKISSYLFKIAEHETITLNHTNDDYDYFGFYDFSTFVMGQIDRVIHDFQLNVSNMTIVDMSGENKYVKNATQQKYIDGIAKQSGNAGETIEVYVPQV